MNYSLHKEGKPIILIAFLVLIILATTTYLLLPILYSLVLTGGLLILLLLIIQFFRIPNNRRKTINPNAIVSPADGKVVVIENTYESEYFKKDCLLISVFMSPLNVHQNTAPIKGNIKYVKHHSGKFLAAFNPKSSELNERNTIVIGNKEKSILVRQIAGAMARRICCYVNADDVLEQNDEFGFIRFGSRVDVYLPLEARPMVKIGDKVKNSVSVLAEF